MTLDTQILKMAEEGLVTFKVADRFFAIPIGLVREINRQLDMTRVYQAPKCIRGLVNLRGQIVTVMDLGERVGVGVRRISEESRLVVLKENADLRSDLPPEIRTADDSIGLLVDEISDVLTPERSDLESPPPNLKQSEGRHMVAVCKTCSATVGILNPASLVKSVISASEAKAGALGSSTGYGINEG